LKKRFTIKELGPLRRHLQIYYDRRLDAEGNWCFVASLPKTREEIINHFEKVTGKTVKEAQTPGYPRKYLRKHEGEPDRIDEYRSIVGKILYYAKKVSPDMNNAARELAQFLSNPGPEHWKALARSVGYIKANHFKGELIISKPKEMRPIGGADSNHATNEKDRKSIMSEIHTLGGAYIMSTSKKIPTVTLSSSESEHYSNSCAATESKFEYMLLDEMFLHDHEERKTAVLYNDNMGAIYLSKNQHVGAQTKHIDIRAHFIRELQERNIVKMQFERSENLIPDMLNKNLPERDHLRHAKNLLGGSMIVWREDVRGGSRKLGFIQSNQDLQSTVMKQDQDRTVEYRKKNEARSESVINELASVNANKRRSVTWDPNIIIKDKRKRNDGWITVTRRNGNRRKEL
jgi:hypothetical protein